MDENIQFIFEEKTGKKYFGNSAIYFQFVYCETVNIVHTVHDIKILSRTTLNQKIKYIFFSSI